VKRLTDHLKNNSFEPLTIDGKDPSAFIGAILNAEKYLQMKVDTSIANYPIKMSYIIAETIKGFESPNAGANNAHNLPLGRIFFSDLEGRKMFNEGMKKLWVEPKEIDLLRNEYFPFEYNFREKEKNHSLANRNIKLEKIPEVKPYNVGGIFSPMEAIDGAFVSIALENSFGYD